MKHFVSLDTLVCGLLLFGATVFFTACTHAVANESATNDTPSASVYFTQDISPAGLVNIYNALGVTIPENARVAVKISTGESSKSNHLRPDFIAPLVNQVNGRLVECNTAYGGNRSTTANHRQAIEERGYVNVDIMDEEGTMNIPVSDTKWLQYDIVGSHLANYDFMINLAHFKGHAMGGFGGVLKNQSIGVAARSGKLYIHSAGRSTTNWTSPASQDAFLESMAAAAQAVHNYFKQDGRNIVYINVMNNLSVDCDCDGNPHKAEMNDIGILASTDPVALDKACLDLVFNYNSTSGDDATALQNRITSLHGTHTVEYAEQIGLGTQVYRLVSIDNTGQGLENTAQGSERYNVFTADGKKVLSNAASLDGLQPGTYIINGQKQVIQ